MSHHPPSLALGDAHRRTIHAHAASTYPEECCGVLVGRLGDGGGGTAVERIFPVDNARRDSRHNRYLIDPETVLAAQRQAREQALEVVGYYHSHPDHPARPSDFDREHAWPGLSYVIVSVEEGVVADTRCWTLSDDRESFHEQDLEEGGGGEAVPTNEEER